tara:strand:+ start:4627 stop:5163 length:537 start_codon:yes stop_codon:yes gene_type:complete
MANSLSDLDIPTSESSGLFMKKLEQGQNRMRILNTPIQGYVWWPEDEGKPKRVKEANQIPTGVKDAKYFWFLTIAMGSEIKFLEIKQKTILSQIKALSDNKEWGEVQDYDITITRSGQDLETQYTVVPNPKKAIDDEAAKKWAGMKARYSADSLFINGSPLEPSEEKAQNNKDEDLPF